MGDTVRGMDVFLLHHEVTYAEWDVCGVYSTLERAQAAHAAIYGEVEWKSDADGRWSFMPDAGRGAQIERVTVDS